MIATLVACFTLFDVGGKVVFATPGAIRELVAPIPGTLFAFTDSEAINLISGRRKKLVRDELTQNSNTNFEAEILPSPNPHKVIGNGFVIDLRTLQSRPINRSSFWIGNEIAHVKENTIVHNSKRSLIAPGWEIMSIEATGHGLFAYASRKVPSDLVDTSLLQIDPGTGKAKVILTCAKSSDDHVHLRAIRRLGSKWFGHRFQIAAGVYLRNVVEITIGQMKEVKLPDPKGDSLAEQIEPILGSNWALARRIFFSEQGPVGYDRQTLELWHPHTNKRIVLKTLTDSWPTNNPDSKRGDEDVFGPVIVTKSTVYAVQVGPKGSKLLKFDISNYIR